MPVYANGTESGSDSYRTRRCTRLRHTWTAERSYNFGIFLIHSYIGLTVKRDLSCTPGPRFYCNHWCFRAILGSAVPIDDRNLFQANQNRDCRAELLADLTVAASHSRTRELSMERNKHLCISWSTNSNLDSRNFCLTVFVWRNFKISSFDIFRFHCSVPVLLPPPLRLSDSRPQSRFGILYLSSLSSCVSFALDINYYYYPFSYLLQSSKK